MSDLGIFSINRHFFVVLGSNIAQIYNDHFTSQIEPFSRPMKKVELKSLPPYWKNSVVSLQTKIST